MNRMNVASCKDCKRLVEILKNNFGRLWGEVKNLKKI